MLTRVFVFEIKGFCKTCAGRVGLAYLEIGAE